MSAAYGVFNDVSASDMIKRDGKFDRGKNLPTFGPFGPYLASADEVRGPAGAEGRAERRWQDACRMARPRRHAVSASPTLVSYLSHRQPLEPGDVIATGTPAGVAAMHKPPAWLRPGTIGPGLGGRAGRPDQSRHRRAGSQCQLSLSCC